MKIKKKTARRLQPSSSRVLGLRREQLLNYYIKFLAECKPQFGRGRGCFPHVLGIYAYSHRIGLSG